MPVKKHFITKGIQYMMIDEYLRKKFIDAGYAKVKIENTLLSTRITIHAARPGLLIGPKGKSINELTNFLANDFKVEGPQVKITSVKVPELDGHIMANRLAFNISKGENFRRATYSILRRVMREEARGAEVIISGQMTSQRARRQSFRVGVIPKAGFPAMDGISVGIAHCQLKQGILGIICRIFPSSYQMPDTIILKEEASVKKNATKIVDLKRLEIEAGDDLIDDEDELFDENADAIEDEIEQELSEYEELIESEDEDESNDEIEDLLDEAESISEEIDSKVEEMKKDIVNESEEKKKKTSRGRKKKE